MTTPGPQPQAPVTPDAPFLSIAFSARELCTRCGSCAGVCPTDAITMGPDAYPVLAPDRCISCGLCGAVCPGKSVNYGDLAEQVFGERFVDEGFDGRVARTYVGFAADERLRRGGAGGGVVTGLLAYLLKSGQVDGCLVSRMKTDTPWMGEPFIATTYAPQTRTLCRRHPALPDPWIP